MRRVFRILGIVVAVSAVVISTAVAVLNSSRVQTRVVGMVTDRLSESLGTDAHISAFAYDFPNHLHIDGVFIADLEGDTLLSIEHATADFRLLDLFAKRITIKQIELRRSYADIVKDTAGVMNYAFIADYFKSDKQKERKALPTIQVKDVWVNDARVRVRSQESGTRNQEPGVRSQEGGNGLLRREDIYVDSLNLLFSLNYLSEDSVDAEIKHLFAHEQSGLEVSRMEARLIINDKEAYMPKMIVALPNSHISTSVVHAYFPSDSLLDIGKVRTDLRIDDASVVLRDLAPIAPSIRKIDLPIRLQAQIRGSVDSLNATGLQIAYHGKSLLRGDVRLQGLPDIEQTFFRAQLQDLCFDPKLFEEFLSDLYDRQTKSSQMLYHLGTVHYQGQLAGKIDSMQLVGAATSRLGDITTNGLLRTKKHILEKAREESNDTTTQTFELRDLAFNGAVETDSFALGELLGISDLGAISMDVEMDGYTAGEQQQLHGSAKAHIRQITYRDYDYKDILLDGNYANKSFQGSLSINDKNMAFDFGGLVDFHQKVPKLRFDLNLARLKADRLHLTDKLKNSDLSLKTNIDLAVGGIDNINGTVSLNDVHFENNGKSVDMQKLLLTASSPAKPARTRKNGKTAAPNIAPEPRTISLKSDFINASLTGDLPLGTLKSTVMQQLACYLPLLFGQYAAETSKVPTDSLELCVYMKDLDRIAQVLDIDFEMPQTSTIRGRLVPARNVMQLQATVPQIHYNKLDLADLTFSLGSDTTRLTTLAHAMRLHSRHAKAEADKNIHYNIDLDAHKDAVALAAQWHDNANVRQGIVNTLTRLMPPSNEKAKTPLFDLTILPSSLILHDSVWSIAPSEIIYNHTDTIIDIRHFEVGTASQSIAANGIASRLATDSLYVKLRNIDLGYVLGFTHIKKQAVTFSGLIDGWVQVYSILSNPMFEADARIDNAYINQALMGDAHAIATLDKAKKRVVIDGNLTDNNRRVAHVDGEVIPAIKYWGLDIDVDSARLTFIEHWTQKFLREVDGRGYGHIKVYGQEKDTYVIGKVYGDEASFLVPVIGTHFSFSDTVILDTTAIILHNIDAYDDQHHKVMVDGVVGHDRFRDFTYDLHIDADRAHAVSLSPAAKGVFYGDAYATGTVDIHGNDYLCRIDIEAQTEPRTNISLAIAAQDNAKDDSFVEFVKHEQQPEPIEVQEVQEDDKEGRKERRKGQAGMLLGLRLDFDEDAAVNLLVGKNGDLLKARGHGALNIDYNDSESSAQLRGDYTISSGTFDFTLQNLIHRSFSFQRGSRIIFDGNAANPEIEATAVYSTTASLKDLFGSDYATVATTRSSVPVNCLLYLKGRLSNPTISFGIELPQSDESVTTQVRNVINTDEMLMREIIYLLAFNRFYTPDYMQNSTTPVGLGETYSLLTSTLTGQINNWLSKMTDNFTVGFNFRTDGEGSSASQEYETQFQLQPTNRLLINGNIGYRYNDISNQPVFGNLDVEYLLTPSGQWRAKAYTHSVDKYSLREASTVQGVGFRFQQDFNIGDIKKNKEARQRRREEAKRQRREKASQPNTNRNLHKIGKRS